MTEQQQKTDSNLQQPIDPSKISLDDAGRFEIDPSLLGQVSGGRWIEVIRGTKCTKEPG